MNTCIVFALYTPNIARQLQSADPMLVSPRGGSSEPDVAKLDQLDVLVNRYEHNFTHHLKVLVNALNYYAATESVALLGLLSNLDWNREWELGTS